MAAHKEIDFIIPMLKIINKHVDGCSTDVIIDEIETEIKLTKEDFEESKSRKNEYKYKQIIRNLISHKNKNLFNKITVSIVDSKKVFKINTEGQKYLTELTSAIVKDDKNAEEISFQEMCIENDDKQDIYDKKLFDMVSNPAFTKIIKDKSLAECIKKIHNYECLYTKIINGPCMTFRGADGNEYVEAHHLIPINAWKDFFPKSLDRPSNLAPLAEHYHKILHHGANEEIKKILKPLYDAMIDGINKDGIYIDFETLFNKYYKKGD